MNLDKKNIATADFPLLLWAVEEREKKKDELIRLWLSNSNWMQVETSLGRKDASPLAEPISADWLNSTSVIKKLN